MQTVPWIFGIMHPTGFPVFTIAAGVFAHVFAVGAVSWRIALFSAIAMSGTAWLAARLALELDAWPRERSASEDAAPWIAMGSAWLFAFGSIAWTRGTRAEVHALAAFFGIFALFAVVRWCRTGERAALCGGAIAWGLGIATHPLTVLLAPAFIVALAARARALRWRTALAAAGLLILGIAFYAYLPVRSYSVVRAGLDPVQRLGLPPGGAFWNTDNPSTLRGWKQEVSGEQFGAADAFLAMLRVSTYRSAGPGYALHLLQELTPLALLLALGGLYALARLRWWLAFSLLLALWAPVAFAFGYVIEADPERYYTMSFAILAALAGYGACAIARALPLLRLSAALSLIALGVALGVVNAHLFGQRNDPGARSVIRTVQQKTPPNAVLISPWIYATPLAYAAYVEGSLDRRIIVSAWLKDEAQYVPMIMRTRPVYVVGILNGDVPGYTVERINGSPDLYRLVKQ